MGFTDLYFSRGCQVIDHGMIDLVCDDQHFNLYVSVALGSLSKPKYFSRGGGELPIWIC